MTCIFCSEVVKKNAFTENEYFYSVYDIHPVSEGHALVIAKRHMESAFELSSEEGTALIDALKKTRQKILEKHKVDAFNLGVNDGEAAGQIIKHFHMHVIPRKKQDKGKAIEAIFK